MDELDLDSLNKLLSIFQATPQSSGQFLIAPSGVAHQTALESALQGATPALKEEGIIRKKRQISAQGNPTLSLDELLQVLSQ